MLVVTVELWPFGDEARKHTIATGVIANDGTGDNTMGNYDAVFANDLATVDYLRRTLREKTEGTRILHVSEHPRALGPWSLLFKALGEWRRSVYGH